MRNNVEKISCKNNRINASMQML